MGSDLRKTWLQLCSYCAIRADITSPSSAPATASLIIGEHEVLRFQISPPEASEPLLRLIEGYAEIAYGECAPASWRQWAVEGIAPLERLATLSNEERTREVLNSLGQLSREKETYLFTEALWPMATLVAGEIPAYSPPSLLQLEEIYGQYLRDHYEEAIEETIELYRWLAEKASDEDVRLFVSLKCAYGCLIMASVVGRLIELALTVGIERKTPSIRLMKQAILNPIADAVLELASAFRGLGGDTDVAIGTLWDAGIHSQAKEINWQEVEKQGGSLHEPVQEAAIHLIDTLARYVDKVAIPDILVKGASEHLRNSLSKTSYNLYSDRREKAQKMPKPITISELRSQHDEAPPQQSDEELLAKLSGAGYCQLLVGLNHGWMS